MDSNFLSPDEALHAFHREVETLRLRLSKWSGDAKGFILNSENIYNVSEAVSVFEKLMAYDRQQWKKREDKDGAHG